MNNNQANMIMSNVLNTFEDNESFVDIDMFRKLPDINELSNNALINSKTFFKNAYGEQAKDASLALIEDLKEAIIADFGENSVLNEELDITDATDLMLDILLGEYDE